MGNGLVRMMLWLSACLLSACAASGIAFSGESATFGGDNVLRNDVLAMVRRFEQDSFGCRKVKAVASEIVSKRKVRGRWRFDEVWQVSACGTVRRYAVLLREDAQGETDFSVTLVSGKR